MANRIQEEEKKDDSNSRGAKKQHPITDPLSVRGADKESRIEDDDAQSEQLEYDDVEGEDKFVDEEEEDEDHINEHSEEVIKIVNVHKTYLLGLEGVPALRGVNLTIKDGEFITILGTSGGGKTTMLNIIGTIDKPSKGDVYICGLRIKYNTKD